MKLVTALSAVGQEVRGSWKRSWPEDARDVSDTGSEDTSKGRPGGTCPAAGCLVDGMFHVVRARSDSSLERRSSMFDNVSKGSDAEKSSV